MFGEFEWWGLRREERRESPLYHVGYVFNLDIALQVRKTEYCSLKISGSLKTKHRCHGTSVFKAVLIASQ